MRGKRPSPPVPLTERIARAIISNAQGEYSAEEVARVKDALENHPAGLARVLAKIHETREKGDDG